LKPENESDSAAGAGIPKLTLRIQRHIAADDDIGPKVGCAFPDPLSDLYLQKSASQELGLIESLVKADPLHLE
jgi:hypothetical protein